VHNSVLVRPPGGRRRNDTLGRRDSEKIGAVSGQRPATMIIVAGGVLLLRSVMGGCFARPPLRFCSPRAFARRRKTAGRQGAPSNYGIKCRRAGEPVLASVHPATAMSCWTIGQRITSHWSDSTGRQNQRFLRRALCLIRCGGKK